MPARPGSDVTAAHALLSLDGTLDGEFELVIEAGLDAAVLVVDLSGSDGFVSDTVAPSRSGRRSRWSCTCSSRTGLSLGGQPTFRISVPVSRSIGPVSVSAIGLGLGSEGGSATFDATVTAAGTLGPFTVTVAETGLRVRITPVQDGAPAGNLGLAHAGIGFKPPSGAGLDLHTSGLSGGGFIGRDPASGRYSGVLNLRAGQIDITALGLLDTKLPGAQRDYALLVALGATFPAVEIGFGFALTGVGGLIAPNRRLHVDTLRNRLASGTAGRIRRRRTRCAERARAAGRSRRGIPDRSGDHRGGPDRAAGLGRAAAHRHRRVHRTARPGPGGAAGIGARGDPAGRQDLSDRPGRRPRCGRSAGQYGGVRRGADRQ